MMILFFETWFQITVWPLNSLCSRSRPWTPDSLFACWDSRCAYHIQCDFLTSRSLISRKSVSFLLVLSKIPSNGHVMSYWKDSRNQCVQPVMLTGINSDTLGPLSCAMVFTMQISMLPNGKTGCVWKKHSSRERSYIHSLEVSHIYPCCIKLAFARKSTSWLCGSWKSKFTVNVVGLLWIVFQTLEFHEKLFLNL